MSYDFGCCFVDIVLNSANQSLLQLKRASFDGHGCCEVSEEWFTPMDADHSGYLLSILRRGPNGEFVGWDFDERVRVKTILKTYFTNNRKAIEANTNYTDAFEDYDWFLQLGG